MKYYSDDQVTATLKAESADWEKDWRGAYLAYMDHRYGAFMRAFGEGVFFDERSTYMETYNRICEALSSLPRVPSLYIRVAVDRSINEDCRILEDIASSFGDRVDPDGAGKAVRRQAHRGCPFVVLCGNEEKDSRALSHLDPSVRLIDGEGFSWSGEELRRAYEKGRSSGCDAFCGTFYLAV